MVAIIQTTGAKCRSAMQPDVMEVPKASAGSANLARRFGFLLLLMISGFCGISYEVLYGRLLSNFVGDQFAISSSILLTFMLGIGFGALHAHRLWSRLWIIEAVIGGYAAAAALGSNRVASFFYASSLLSHGIA